jgi:pimeloyl-ACP methyl ester carboxylesterase
VVEVLDAAGASAAVLVSHSLGAQVAVDVALAYPDRAAGVVLLGPWVSGFVASRMPEGMGALAAALRGGDSLAVREALVAMPVFSLTRDTARAAETRTILRENVRLLRANPALLRPPAAPALGRLDSLRLPVLVLEGERDRGESGAVAQVLAQRVPGLRRAVLAGCGHMIPLDCPTDALREMRVFLAALAPRSGGR